MIPLSGSTRRYGDRAGYLYSDREDVGLFWSNDPQLPVGEMVKQLGITPMREHIELTRRERERIRGKPIWTVPGDAAGP